MGRHQHPRYADDNHPPLGLNKYVRIGGREGKERDFVEYMEAIAKIAKRTSASPYNRGT